MPSSKERAALGTTGIIAYGALFLLLVAAVVLAAVTLGYAVDIDKDVDCLKCPKNSTGCSDGNPCTQDVLLYGGCQHYNSPNGAACATNCLAASTGVCSAGACTGTCVGTCFNASTCVDISGDTTIANATCESAGCLYAANKALPTAFNSTCNTDSVALKDICKVGVSSTYVDCLQVDLNCDVAGMFTCIFTFACTAWAT